MRDDKLKRHIIEMAEQDVPNVKHLIKADPRFKVPTHEKRFNFGYFNRRPLQLASALFILVIALVISLNQLPQTIEASATVYIDINPSLEIDIDDEDNVITIRSNNAQALEMIPLLQNYKGKAIGDVIDQIVDLAISLNYLNADNPYIMIDVDSEHNLIRSHVLSVINERIPEIAQNRLPNMEVIPGNARNQDESEVDEARNNQVSIMKYRLIQEVLSHTDAYTKEELNQMSIGELRRILINDNSGGNPGDHFRP
ncbi:anti-sigma-I factor RsgI family protein [Liberiplasma polymorphum]|jgi:hypothetical protein|uniref:anti-sigma-I factor RsgI family protein n=1 Tax=Liberiplasma polymorphum TaxID=3374570 RepID=UPI0037756968